MEKGEDPFPSPSPLTLPIDKSDSFLPQKRDAWNSSLSPLSLEEKKIPLIRNDREGTSFPPLLDM